MPVYRAEVTLWSLFPSPDDLDDPPTGCSYSGYFTATDDFNVWGISVTAEPDMAAISGYRVRFQFYVASIGDPAAWALVSGVSQVIFHNPVFVFPQVWTIAIQKDTAADTLVFVTPFGSVEKPLSDFFVVDDSLLRPGCHGDGIVIPSLTEASGGTSQWRDFFGYVDDQKFIGAALTAADPGVWTPTASFATGGGLIPNTDAQETNDYLFGFSALLPTGLDRRRMRCWFAGDNIPVPVPPDPALKITALDAVVHPISGTLLVAAVVRDSPEMLQVFRSTDDGETLTPVPLATDAGCMFSDPSILVTPGGLVYLFYNDGQRGKINYAVSHNDGLDWLLGGFYNVVDLVSGTPSLLDKPRFRCDSHGIVWGCWNNPDNGHLLVQKFPVLGSAVEGPPVVVETGLDAFYRPDLWFLSRGEALVRFRHSFTHRVKNSVNWGYDWQTVVNSREDELRQSSVTSRDSGLTHHLYQLGSGSLFHSASDDGGDNMIASFVVTTGLDPQYPALAVGHRGQLYALAIDSGSLVCYRSYDWGTHWDPV